MAVTKRYGRQTPTRALVLPYTETRGMEAVESYNRSGRTSYSWQELLASDVMAVNEDGLWLHQKFGFSVPRRNGKNEVVVMREIYGLEHGREDLPYCPPHDDLAQRIRPPAAGPSGRRIYGARPHGRKRRSAAPLLQGVKAVRAREHRADGRR